MKEREHANPAVVPPHPALLLGYSNPRHFKDLEERIENAMKIMADIIADDGEEYLPIFLMLEEELEQYRMKKSALERALSLSSAR